MIGSSKGQRLVPVDLQICVVPVQAAGEQLHRIAGHLLHHGGITTAGRHAETGIAVFSGHRVFRGTGIPADNPNGQEPGFLPRTVRREIVVAILVFEHQNIVTGRQDLSGACNYRLVLNEPWLLSVFHCSGGIALLKGDILPFPTDKIVGIRKHTLAAGSASGGHIIAIKFTQLYQRTVPAQRILDGADAAGAGPVIQVTGQITQRRFLRS